MQPALVREALGAVCPMCALSLPSNTWGAALPISDGHCNSGAGNEEAGWGVIETEAMEDKNGEAYFGCSSNVCHCPVCLPSSLGSFCSHSALVSKVLYATLA